MEFEAKKSEPKFHLSEQVTWFPNLLTCISVSLLSVCDARSNALETFCKLVIATRMHLMVVMGNGLKELKHRMTLVKNTLGCKWGLLPGGLGRIWTDDLLTSLLNWFWDGSDQEPKTQARQKTQLSQGTKSESWDIQGGGDWRTERLTAFLNEAATV